MIFHNKKLSEGPKQRIRYSFYFKIFLFGLGLTKRSKVQILVSSYSSNSSLPPSMLMVSARTKEIILTNKRKKENMYDRIWVT